MVAHEDYPEILLVPTVAGVGGATRVVATLAAAWNEQGRQVRLVFPDPRSEDTQRALEWVHETGVQAEASAMVPAWYEPHGLRRMHSFRRYLREARAKAVYLHYGSNQIAFKDVLAARLAFRGRVVVMVHHAAPILGRKRQVMTRIGAMLAHRVVVSTPAMADLLAGIGVPRRKMEIIPLTVAKPDRSPSKSDARASLGLPADAFVVSSVARLDRGKNVPALVRAVAELGPKAHLVVGGHGEDFEQVQAAALEHLGDRGHVLGRVPSVEEIYAASDVFVLPSAEEGFGLVYLEAAWHGVPSVGCDVGGVRYAISDGSTGILVPLNDHAALVAALRSLFEDPALRNRLGKAARERVESQFTVDRMATLHARVLGLRGPATLP